MMNTGKIFGFGSNGAGEVHGDTVVISKNGKSIDMSKREITDMIIKLGICKRK